MLKRKIPPHIKKLILITTIMILAFLGFTLAIERGKETSLELTKEATQQDQQVDRIKKESL